MKVAIACGGTGGHLFPGIAVAEVLHERGHQVLLLISEKQVDATAVRDRTEFRIERIPAIGLPRVFSLDLPRFVLKAVEGLARCRRVYRDFKPQAVLGMGGFTSTWPILAGRLRRLPTFIHESNAIPGKANRLNARLASRVLVGFEDCRRFFPGARVEVTGTPIRASLRKRVDGAAARRNLGLKTDFQTVLIMGGSQGAHGINQAVLATLARFAGRPVQFIHLTGLEDQNTVSKSYECAGIPAFVGAFHHHMEIVYGAADLAVARSGAASLAELAYFGVPSVLIPFPHAAENHQLLNAEIFARQGAAEVIQEARVGKDTLGSLIDRLLADEAGRKQMVVRMRALAPQDSAERIARLIETSVK